MQARQLNASFIFSVPLIQLPSFYWHPIATQLRITNEETLLRFF